eukprot:2252339-Pleurochrysis_carterae.AAC.1
MPGFRQIPIAPGCAKMTVTATSTRQQRLVASQRGTSTKVGRSASSHMWAGLLAETPEMAL